MVPDRSDDSIGAVVAQWLSETVADGFVTCPAAVFLDYWNTFAKHDSLFQKSSFLAHRVGRHPTNQAPFAGPVFQKSANSRLKMNVPKFTP